MIGFCLVGFCCCFVLLHCGLQLWVFHIEEQLSNIFLHHLLTKAPDFPLLSCCEFSFLLELVEMTHSNHMLYCSFLCAFLSLSLMDHLLIISINIYWGLALWQPLWENTKGNRKSRLDLNVPHRKQVRPKCEGERSGDSWEKVFCFVYYFHTN